MWHQPSCRSRNWFEKAVRLDEFVVEGAAESNFAKHDRYLALVLWVWAHGEKAEANVDAVDLFNMGPDDEVREFLFGVRCRLRHVIENHSRALG